VRDGAEALHFFLRLGVAQPHRRPFGTQRRTVKAGATIARLLARRAIG
jgi:hypothetical protein